MRMEHRSEAPRRVAWDRVSALEACLAVAALALACLTVVMPTWIEAITGWDPDHQGAGAEWLIAGVLALCAASAGLAARRRLRAVSAS